MIDFHAHILPRIDDGSQSVEESIELLRMLAKQDVTHVVATPHYDATRESPEQFLERRQRSYETLKAALPEEGIPEICLGAEVMYFPGIGGIEALPSLCLSRTGHVDPGTRGALLARAGSRGLGPAAEQRRHHAGQRVVFYPFCLAPQGAGTAEGR